MKPDDIHNKFYDWVDRYIEDDLPAEVRETVASHLDKCPDCSETLARRRSIRRLMLDDRAPLPTAEEWVDFHRQLRLRLGEERKKGFSLFPSPLRWATLGAAAVALFVALILSRDTGNSHYWPAMEVAAREEILDSYSMKPAGITSTFGEATLDSAVVNWLWSDMDSQTLIALIDAVEDPTIHRDGDDLIFRDLSEEELLLSLKEVL